jgi:predicted ABC-type ATPase
MKPVALFLAGPNGSGKSTLAQSPAFMSLLQRHNMMFINPDDLALTAPPNSNSLIWSGRQVRSKIDVTISQNSSFAVETTLSGRNHFLTLSNCQSRGYYTSLHFVFLSSLELSKRRVALRVLLGGHDVSEHDQDRRYKKSIGNGLELARLVDEAFFYTNDTEEGHELVARATSGQLEWISNQAPDWLRLI